jgi:outer membrane protein assembly factor BamB
MTIAETHEPIRRKPLRLWPGVLAATFLLLARFVVPIVVPETVFFGVIAGLLCTLVIVIWWAFFSRAPGWDRWGALVLMIVALAATSRILHESIRGGMMGMMFPLSAIPGLAVALVVWAVASRRLADGPRRAAMVATIVLACGVWTLVRTDGITGAGSSEFAWRWTATPEERLLAQAGDAPAALPSVRASPKTSEEALAARAGSEPAIASAATATETSEKPRAAQPGDERANPAAARIASAIPAAANARAEWPGFRGPRRDGIVHGLRINTDWTASPPVELWRRPVGPGWSSFAVSGDRLYTQEQRGDDEVVACYNTTTGEPVWIHRDAVRFWESNGGAGPRGTPTVSNGRVYTLGATGILNALDAGNGAVAWSRNAASDTGATLPGWGFAGSPLVVGDLVIVAASGALVAYDRVTGERRWVGEASDASYSSPHLVTIDGVPQVLLLSGAGATSVTPGDGTVLWQHSWPGAPIVQPAVIADGDVLISTSGMSGGLGTRRISVAHGSGGWTVEERWTSNGLKSYFNDFVVHNGHAFGFDGFILACIDLEDGKRKWKGGRYGNGQLVLLPDQDLLLVLSEEGELALVRATPDQFTELARVPALDGKTWNHPVLVGDVLVVRNGQEMAAFRLSLADR